MIGVTQVLDQARQLLQTYFGYDSFREGQETVINYVLNENSSLCVMPTGGGKSLCYQILLHASHAAGCQESYKEKI